MLVRLTIPVALTLSIAGCAGAPDGPPGDRPDTRQQIPYLTSAPATRRDSVLAVRQVARFMALALADSAFRVRVFEALHGSRVREQKLQMQRFFRRRGAALARRIEVANGLPDGSFGQALALLPDLEVYLPIPEDRSRWLGGADILVAGFIEGDGEIRGSGDHVTAFDITGAARPISYDSAANRPVLVITGAESVFADDGESPPSGVVAAAVCTGKKCPPPPPPPPDPCAGTLSGGTLVLCRSDIVNVSGYEGFLRGSPEISMKVFSVRADGSGMTQIGCINEDQPSDQFFNQDEDDWAGHARLGTRAVIDQARAAGRNIVMQVWEDDNGSKCDFQTHDTDVRKGLQYLGAAGALLSFGWLTCVTDGSCSNPQPWPLFLAGLSIGALSDYILGSDDDPIGFVALPAGSNPFNGYAPILWLKQPDTTPLNVGSVQLTVLP
jgi:hypothetical protein